jgi:hypothetical protein
MSGNSVTPGTSIDITSNTTGCLLVDAAAPLVLAAALLALALLVALAPAPVALLVVLLAPPQAATPITVQRTAATNPTRDLLRRMLSYLPSTVSSNSTIPVPDIEATAGLVW